MANGCHGICTVCSGEPNDWTGEEDCVEMYSYDGTWNDNPCNYQRGVACKKAAQNAPPVVENGKFCFLHTRKGWF